MQLHLLAIGLGCPSSSCWGWSVEAEDDNDDDAYSAKHAHGPGGMADKDSRYCDALRGGIVPMWC